MRGAYFEPKWTVKGYRFWTIRETHANSILQIPTQFLRSVKKIFIIAVSSSTVMRQFGSIFNINLQIHIRSVSFDFSSPFKCHTQPSELVIISSRS